MKPKKSQKANLEKSRFMYFQVGIIIALTFILFAFEFGREERKTGNDDMLSSQLFLEDDVMISIKQREPEPKKIEIYTIINKVDDKEIILEEPDFSKGEIEPGDYFNPDDFIQREEIFEDTIEFRYVEEMPLFNGGIPDIEFTKYISQNLRYPSIAIENGAQGKVILTFVINKQGWVEDLSVYYSAHQDLGQAAMTVVQSSPQWTPGKQSGKPVRVRYYFPVTFKLN